MEEPFGAAQVDDDEGETHEDGGDGEELAEDDEVMKLLIFVDVDGDDDHDGGVCHADEEGEIRDVDAPGDLVGHVSDDEAIDELPGVGVEADEAYGDEDADPEEVAPISLENQPGAAGEEDEVGFEEANHTSK